MPYSILAALRARDPATRYVDGGLIEIAGRAATKLLRLLGRPGDLRFSKPFAWFAGGWASLRLATMRADFVLAVAASNYVAYLRTRKPILYVSDATFAAIARIYPEFGGFPDWLRRHADTLERRGLGAASRIVYSSEWARCSAIRDYGVAAHKIQILPFGANLASSLLDRRRTKALDPSRPLRLLYVSADWERKNGDLALAIAAELRHRGLDCEIFLVGDVPARVASIAGVHVIGFLDKRRPCDQARLCELYELADLLVLPTKADCSPIVFSEAAAFGCPSIAFDVGGIASAVLDGETGILLSPNATASVFADRIVALVRDAAAYSEMSRRARRRYEEAANWDVWAGSILALAEGVGSPS